MRLLIVGGSDAGISAALRARELNPNVQPTIIMADNFPNFSICGLPFFLSGEVPDWHQLAHRSGQDIEAQGIQLLTNHTAEQINPARKVVQVKSQGGQSQQLPYDKLVIATGASSIRPKIEGLDLPGVYVLRWMEDSFAVQQHLTDRAPQSALIVGGGYIGLEMADALTLRKLAVTVVEHSATVLKTVDPTLGNLVAAELQRHGVEVVNRIGITKIESQGTQLLVSGSDGFSRTVDLVLVAVGVTPSTQLAQTAGVNLSERGAIAVNRRMETNIPDIYAAGDCVETWHHLLQKSVYTPLGTTAHKQGRVAGENAVGGQREFAGTLGTQVVKVFDLAIARTGLRDDEAQAAGFSPKTVETKVWDHKAYYPGANELTIRVTGDDQTGRLLGAQMAGHYQAEVAKRIDIFATALFHEMQVEDINDLDLSYTPPLGSPWDAVQLSAQVWSK